MRPPLAASANSVHPAGSAGAVVGGVVVGGTALVVGAAVVAGGAVAPVCELDPVGLPINTTISVNDSSASSAEPVPTTSPRRPGSSSQSTALRQSGTTRPPPARPRAARPTA